MQNPKRTYLAVGGVTLLSAAFSLSFQEPTRKPVPAPADIPPVGALGGPRSELSGSALAQFLSGQELFDKNFERSDGVGAPEMNADSCRACHQIPVLGGAGPLELNVSRFAFDNGGAGPYTDLPGGQAASKLFPPFTVGREEIPANADVFEQRQTPALFGAGLIDEIFESEILANEDPTDMNGDGVYGVARMVNTGTMEVGRFGWKAQIPKLADFVRDALGGECGLTTSDDGRGFALVSDSDAVADPEIIQSEIDDIAFFMASLAAPQRQGGSVAPGEALFHSVGCAKCHVPELDSPGGPVALYSDLLLHNVMDAGYRGMSEPGAEVGMFRTPPLWGVRMTPPYMHDGRAEDLPGAILAHYGEATNVKNAYLALGPADKLRLLAFLEDL